MSNLKFEKHERGMKKAHSSRLRSEVVDPEAFLDFTTDEAREALLNINSIKAAGPDKIHPRFLHHLGPVSISMLTSIFNKSWAETKVPQEWRVAHIRPMPTGVKDLQKMESYLPMSLKSIVGKTMERLFTNRLRYFAELMHKLTEY